MKKLREGLKMPFSEFWPLYLDAHRKSGTRTMHYLATLLGMISTAVAIATGTLLIAPAGILVAVAMAVSSHWVIEKNQPLIMVNPFYGAVADLKMSWLALTGGLAAEYVRLKLAPIEGADSKTVRPAA